MDEQIQKYFGLFVSINSLLHYGFHLSKISPYMSMSPTGTARKTLADFTLDADIHVSHCSGIFPNIFVSLQKRKQADRWLLSEPTLIRLDYL